MKSGVEYLAQHPGWKTIRKDGTAKTLRQKPEGLYVKVEVKELESLLVRATDALEAFGEDLVYDALYSLRDSLAEIVEDPDRRTNG